MLATHATCQRYRISPSETNRQIIRICAHCTITERRVRNSYLCNIVVDPQIWSTYDAKLGFEREVLCHRSHVVDNAEQCLLEMSSDDSSENFFFSHSHRHLETYVVYRIVALFHID